MIKRNEIEGSVTLTIAQFDALTDSNGSIQASLEKERKAVDELEEKILKGMVKFTPSYYGAPWDEGAYWMSNENATKAIADLYEVNYRKENEAARERADRDFGYMSCWEFIMWKWKRKNK